MISRVELIVVEGDLEVPVATKILKHAGVAFSEGTIVNKRGRGNFWNRVTDYDRAAQHLGPVFALADLEGERCVPMLFYRHLRRAPNSRFLCRIAVRMIESWLLADARSISDFLGVPQDRLPRQPDQLANPKRTVVDLARRFTRGEIKADIVPAAGTPRSQGPGYTARLSEFARTAWNPGEARERSASLRRALKAIEDAQP